MHAKNNRKVAMQGECRSSKIVYYINTCKIPGFLLLLKNHIFIARSDRTIFIFHM